MDIHQQLQHLKDLRAILSDIKQHALAPGTYRASDRDAIHSLLSIGIPLVRDLIEENAGLPPSLQQEAHVEDIHRGPRIDQLEGMKQEEEK